MRRALLLTCLTLAAPPLLAADYSLLPKSRFIGTTPH